MSFLIRQAKMQASYVAERCEIISHYSKTHTNDYNIIA